MRRRLLVAATLAAAGLTGTVRVDAMQGGKLKIALVLKSMSDPFTVAMLNAAQNYQKHYASQFALTIRGTATEDDTAVQIRMVDELIKARMNAIVIAPTDSKALTAVVARGVKAGIIIITIDNPLDDAA
jgi:ribose transport system substrate-binding protein